MIFGVDSGEVLFWAFIAAVVIYFVIALILVPGIEENRNGRKR